MSDDEPTEYVTWYDHTCPWITKYCDEYHRVGASIPVAVLRQYLPASEAP